MNEPYILPGSAFQAERALEGELLVARLRGTADIHAIEPLDEFLSALHRDAVSLRAKRVEVDFRELEFMNSSCFKCFVSWIGMVQDLPPAEQYGIALRSNPRVHWQRRSLNALRSFAADLLSVIT
jgi:hypothetical protein